MLDRISYVDTKKKFFNKYLYKMVVWVPAARIVTMNPKYDSADILMRRIHEYDAHETKYMNSKMSWRWLKGKEIKDFARLPQIEYFRSLKDVYKDQIKIRVEEPYLSIYSNDLQTLIDIASNDPEHRTREIHKPASSEALSALERGEILIKKDIGYNYKVVFKEGYGYDKDTLLQIYNYLDSLGDEVKLTKSCVRNLTQRHWWFSNAYFYAKDSNVLTFLSLISPGIVAGIFKLTKL